MKFNNAKLDNALMLHQCGPYCRGGIYYVREKDNCGGRAIEPINIQEIKAIDWSYPKWAAERLELRPEWFRGDPRVLGYYNVTKIGSAIIKARKKQVYVEEKRLELYNDVRYFIFDPAFPFWIEVLKESHEIIGDKHWVRGTVCSLDQVCSHDNYYSQWNIETRLELSCADSFTSLPPDNHSELLTTKECQVRFGKEKFATMIEDIPVDEIRQEGNIPTITICDRRH